MKTIEENVEITLRAFDGMQRAAVSSDLQSKLEAIPFENKTHTLYSKQGWLVAASIAAIIAINVVTAIHYYNGSSNADSSANTISDNVVYKEYFSSEY